VRPHDVTPHSALGVVLVEEMVPAFVVHGCCGFISGKAKVKFFSFHLCVYIRTSIKMERNNYVCIHGGKPKLSFFVLVEETKICSSMLNVL
jgi:hypothetical protein